MVEVNPIEEFLSRIVGFFSRLRWKKNHRVEPTNWDADKADPVGDINRMRSIEKKNDAGKGFTYEETMGHNI